VGECTVEAVNRGIARDPKTLPQLERSRGLANGGATVELLKVLLRMTSERHAVAAIATVDDDLESIAGNDDADVPALKALAAGIVRQQGARPEARRIGAGRGERSRNTGGPRLNFLRHN
jgi:hypothetical protein